MIFVATDVSRYSEAICQLAEEKDITQDILLMVLGPRLQEANRVKAQVAAKSQEDAALGKLLEAAVKEAQGFATSQANSPETLEAHLLEMAGAGPRFAGWHGTCPMER